MDKGRRHGRRQRQEKAKAAAHLSVLCGTSVTNQALLCVRAGPAAPSSALSPRCARCEREDEMDEMIQKSSLTRVSASRPLPRYESRQPAGVALAARARRRACGCRGCARSAVLRPERPPPPPSRVRGLELDHISRVSHVTCSRIVPDSTSDSILQPTRSRPPCPKATLKRKNKETAG